MMMTWNLVKRTKKKTRYMYSDFCHRYLNTCYRCTLMSRLQDPVEKEISAAFDVFAYVDETDLIEKMRRRDVRAAFVQLFNRKVKEEFVREVFMAESIPTGIEALDYDEFRRVYFRCVI